MSRKLDVRKPNLNDLIIILIIVLGLSSIYQYGRIQRKEISKNGIYTIGKFVEIKKYPKSVDFIFKYYVDGIETKGSIEKVENCNCEIGKFYILKYSKKYPDYIEVSLKDEVKDKVRISKSGFEVTEIK